MYVQMIVQSYEFFSTFARISPKPRKKFSRPAFLGNWRTYRSNQLTNFRLKAEDKSVTVVTDNSCNSFVFQFSDHPLFRSILYIIYIIIYIIYNINLFIIYCNLKMMFCNKLKCIKKVPIQKQNCYLLQLLQIDIFLKI